MARGIEGNEIATPRPQAKKTGSSSSTQKGPKQSSIAGFFQKRPAGTPTTVTPAKRTSSNGPSTAFKPPRSSADLTPAPSSAAVASSSPPAAPGASQNISATEGRGNKENGTLPVATINEAQTDPLIETPGTTYSSPARKSKKQVSYAESDAEEDDDEAPFKPVSGNGRAAKRRRISVKDDSDDEYGFDAATQAAMEDDDGMLATQSNVTGLIQHGPSSTFSVSSFSAKPAITQMPPPNTRTSDIADFVVDEDEDEKPTKGRKRPSKSASASRQSTAKPPSPPPMPVEMSEEIPTVSTAQQWNFDPDAPLSTEPRKPRPQKEAPKGPAKKGKAHQTEPADRHPWLAHPVDADRLTPDHPDHDPRTLYIPPGSFNELSAFEKQYWEIKKNYMNTIVFFKKGKFYELYEMDATIGHQLFDLKLTDRVNMRMVGVPEASLDHWANQFVAKGYKIARVDQMEICFGKGHAGARRYQG